MRIGKANAIQSVCHLLEEVAETRSLVDNIICVLTILRIVFISAWGSSYTAAKTR
jgi:hypothetical protein